jgi:putative addiction module component (TIGR02574 family)
MTQPDQDSMSISEKILKVQQLWDEIAVDADAISVDDRHREIVAQRLEEHRASPDDVIPWEDVRDKIRSRRAKH